MKDIFMVRVNLDALRRKAGLCIRPEDKAMLLDGFMYAAAGGEPQADMPPRWQDGFLVGQESYDRARTHQQRMSELGKQSANARSNVGLNVRSNVCSNQANKPTSHQENKPINDQAIPSSDKSDMSGFEAWWDSYGKKVGKKAAAKEWSKLTPEDRDAAMRATPAYVAWKSDPQYRKDPERFLKHRHWEDQIPDHTPADPKEDPDYDPFMDGAITDPDEVRRLLGYSNER